MGKEVILQEARQHPVMTLQTLLAGQPSLTRLISMPQQHGTRAQKQHPPPSRRRQKSETLWLMLHLRLGTKVVKPPRLAAFIA